MIIHQIMAWILKMRNEFDGENTIANNQQNLKIDELSQKIILLLQVNMCLICIILYEWEKRRRHRQCLVP